MKFEVDDLITPEIEERANEIAHMGYLIARLYGGLSMYEVVDRPIDYEHLKARILEDCSEEELVETIKAVKKMSKLANGLL